MDEELLVKQLNIHDSHEIAELHFLAFENFFLTSLGVSFLEVFYRAVLSNDNGCGVGVFYRGQLLGFAIGTKNNEGLYKSLIKSSGLRMLFKAFPSFIINPLKIKRLVVSLFSTRKVVYNNTPCLLSICVSPTIRMKGLGSRLIKEFEMTLLKDGFSNLILTTDRQNNEQVNQFYRRNGYICIESFLQGKREMNYYHKKLKV